MIGTAVPRPWVTPAVTWSPVAWERHRAKRAPEILMGTYGPRNQIWLLAARTLPYAERMATYRDISEMIGASWHDVENAAYWLRKAAAPAATKAKLMAGR